MLDQQWTNTLTRAVASGALAAVALATTGCTAQTDQDPPVVAGNLREGPAPEEAVGADDVPPREEPYRGSYDEGFAVELEDHVGRQVTLLADVRTVLAPTALVVAGAEGQEVEPLLVLTTAPVTGVTEGDDIEFTGEVGRAFDPSVLEERFDITVDHDALADWEGESFVVASAVEPLSVDP